MSRVPDYLFNHVDNSGAVFPAKLMIRNHRQSSFSIMEVQASVSRIARNIALTCMTNLLAGNESNAGWGAAQSQAKIIASEFNEMLGAITARDPNLLRDGIGDTLYTVIGMAYRVGIPLDDDFDQVVQSNLTKFDISPEDAYRTKLKYDEIGIKTYVDQVELEIEDSQMPTLSRRKYFVTRVDGDQVDANGKDYPDGKWLKSTKFVDISLTPLSDEFLIQKQSTGRFQKAASTVFDALAAEAKTQFAYKCALAYGYNKAMVSVMNDEGLTEAVSRNQVASWAIAAAQRHLDVCLAGRKSAVSIGSSTDTEFSAVRVHEVIRAIESMGHLHDDEEYAQTVPVDYLRQMLNGRGILTALRAMGDAIACDLELQQGYYSNLAMPALDSVDFNPESWTHEQSLRLRRRIAAASVDHLMPILFDASAPAYFSVFPEQKASAEQVATA